MVTDYILCRKFGIFRDDAVRLPEFFTSVLIASSSASKFDEITVTFTFLLVHFSCFALTNACFVLMIECTQRTWEVRVCIAMSCR